MRRLIPALAFALALTGLSAVDLDAADRQPRYRQAPRELGYPPKGPIPKGPKRPRRPRGLGDRLRDLFRGGRSLGPWGDCVYVCQCVKGPNGDVCYCRWVCD